MRLGSGYICERVNTGDWESSGRVGGVFAASCRCETSLLLTYSELMQNEEFLRDLDAVDHETQRCKC